jgi:hypothetical protein
MPDGNALARLRNRVGALASWNRHGEGKYTFTCLAPDLERAVYELYVVQGERGVRWEGYSMEHPANFPLKYATPEEATQLLEALEASL